MSEDDTIDCERCGSRRSKTMVECPLCRSRRHLSFRPVSEVFPLDMSVPIRTREEALASIDTSTKRHPDPRPAPATNPFGFKRLPGGALVLLSSVTAVVPKEEPRPTYFGGLGIADTMTPYVEVHVAGAVILDDAPLADVERALWGDPG